MKIMDKKTEKFTEIYNDYYPLVYSKVYSKTNDSDEAEDICHELFTRLYVKYDNIGNAGAWLMSSLNYVVIDYYKKKGKNGTINPDINNEKCSFDDEKHDTCMLIEDAIESIGDEGDYKDRIVFELIAIYNYSYKEAGNHLGLTVSQVRYRFNMAVKRIEEYLKKKGIRSLNDLM